MKLRAFAPRLLPLTIAVMAALLAMKSVSLVRAAVPALPAASAASAPATPAIAKATTASAPAAPPAASAPAASAPAASAPAASAPAASASDAAADTGPNPTQIIPSASAEPPVSDTERALLLDLRHRRGELDAREVALASREAVLVAAEKRLAVRVDELTALQKKLEALEAARMERDDANWTGLVRLYESMKPRDAATIFNDLEMPVLLQVLDRMNERKAAPVLAAMQPERARQVTAQLAELRRKANSPPSAAPGS
jgi:flagellar motility protein MotE (MotC chaperone)